MCEPQTEDVDRVIREGTAPNINKLANDYNIMRIPCDNCGKMVNKSPNKVMVHNFCNYKCAGEYRATHLWGGSKKGDKYDTFAGQKLKAAACGTKI